MPYVIKVGSRQLFQGQFRTKLAARLHLLRKIDEVPTRLNYYHTTTSDAQAHLNRIQKFANAKIVKVK